METRYILVVAGGSGKRIGGSTPKQMIEIQGRPVLAHTLDRFLAFDKDLQVCVVLHKDLFEQWNNSVSKYFSAEDASRIFSAQGGNERVNSVHKGLQAIRKKLGDDKIDAWVAIHDGVRPFVSNRLLKAAFSIAEEKGNAIVAVPVKSSMRLIKEEGGSIAVDRSKYFHVQTPQIFKLKAILSCYENRPHDHFTDDASIAEHAGMIIHLSEGSYDNIKITTPEDVEIAKVRLKIEG